MDLTLDLASLLALDASARANLGADLEHYATDDGVIVIGTLSTDGTVVSFETVSPEGIPLLKRFALSPLDF
ncbi:hypothetical protein QII96_gp3 [ssRNA phage SRR7976310_2]|uniref:Uncharacterized protein n=1 Tax=ssRNA phage SRR7976310_2 TaxID=2786680 RepID=A0A8S5L5K9_9VIRU|nr:hypothetical protein QII96_gp3 [ssRNA phage SRR7976310_2]DAD52719.1 TPA_asm: hypothetical protein [ssRNA phage SRR7976310_2]